MKQTYIKNQKMWYRSPPLPFLLFHSISNSIMISEREKKIFLSNEAEHRGTQYRASFGKSEKSFYIQSQTKASLKSAMPPFKHPGKFGEHSPC